MELLKKVRKRATLHALSPIREWDPPVRPAVPGSARTCPDLPGLARPCESSRPDSKPTPHAQVLWKAVAWQSTNSLKLLLLLLRAILPLRAVQNPVGDPLRAVQTPF